MSYCFKVLYNLYLTRIGRWMHNRSIRPSEEQKEPHTIFDDRSFNYMNDSLIVFIVPYLKDNYGYIVQSTETNEYILVDPADPNMVAKVLKTFKIEGPPKFILITVIYFLLNLFLQIAQALGSRRRKFVLQTVVSGSPNLWRLI